MSDRGVSVTVNYVLGLAIATILITGLVLATGGIIDDRRESTIRGELGVVGERVAAGVEAADRLVLAGGEAVVLEVPTPDQVAGEAYTVDLNATSGELQLRTRDPDVEVTVPIQNETVVATSEAPGGSVAVVLSGSGELEVRTS